MSDPFSNNEEAVPAKSSSPKLLQFSVLTIMLLTAAVGVWVAQIQTAEQTELMRLEIPNLQKAARELIIVDPNQYTAVQHHMTWNDDFRWRIYLPEGHRYQLAFATEKIDSNNLVEPFDTQVVEPGEYELELQYKREKDDSFRIAVLLDEKVIFEQLHPAGWNDNSGSSGASNISDSVQRDVDAPLEIMRTRFHTRDEKGNSSSAQGPVNGILIWLDTVDE
ncbi:MAG: hypothetical protein COA78_34275 [Blastopirellula sp.]|nr:MAG: hypothetical protein COA78_34275 [Blastopirellula sp.]